MIRRKHLRLFCIYCALLVESSYGITDVIVQGAQEQEAQEKKKQEERQEVFPHDANQAETNTFRNLSIVAVLLVSAYFVYSVLRKKKEEKEIVQQGIEDIEAALNIESATEKAIKELMEAHDYPTKDAVLQVMTAFTRQAIKVIQAAENLGEIAEFCQKIETTMLKCETLASRKKIYITQEITKAMRDIHKAKKQKKTQDILKDMYEKGTTKKNKK